MTSDNEGSHEFDPQNPSAEKKESEFKIQTNTTKSHYTGHLIFTLLACALGSALQVGLNLGNLNTPEKVLEQFYNQTYYSRNGESMPSSLLTLLWAVTVSIYCIGAIIGCVLVLPLAGKFGRRTILLWNNSLAIFSAILMVSSKYVHSYELLIAGRLFVGIMSGIVTSISPNYLAEVASDDLRGFCGAASPLAMVTGVLIGGSVGITGGLGTDDLWPVIFALGFVPAIFSLLTLSWCPESPRYLMITKGDEYRAVKALKWLRNNDDVKDEIETMRKEKEDLQSAPGFTFLDFWRLPELRRPFVISLVLQLSLQLSGIGAITFYSTSIFEVAKLSVSTAQAATIGVAALNVLATAVSGSVMDKAGRRPLQLYGLIGSFVATVILVICLVYEKSVPWLADVSILCVCIFIIFFAIGPGCVPWFIVAEMFEQGPRTAAVSISFVVNWLCLFINALLYPFLQSAIHVYSFLVFSGLLLGFIIFTYLYVPETKGKTILEITTMFKDLTQKQRKDKGEKTQLLS